MIAPRDWSSGHHGPRRTAAIAAAVFGVIVCVAALAVFALGGRGQAASTTVDGVPRFLVSPLGSAGAQRLPQVTRAGFAARITRGGFVASSGRGRIALSTAAAGSWEPYRHGAVRTTWFGREAIVVAPGSIVP